MSDLMPDYGLGFSDTKTPQVLNPLKAENYAEIFLKAQVSDPNYNHDLSAAQLWAIKKDNSFHLLSAHPDVYELLTADHDLSHYNGVIIHTTGWAAPLGENGEVEGKPSTHALRRRVALAACVYQGSVGSALSFSDDKEMILDPGSATGSLADALLRFWNDNTIPF
jgi:hypothetical protein